MSAQADLVMTLHLHAPRADVWRAWTDCDRLKQWWGPSGYATPYCRIDLRVGGAFLVGMRSSEGQDVWMAGIYQEVVSGRRLVSTYSFADARGRVASPTRYGFGPDFPEQTLLMVTLEDREEGTELTMRQRGIPLGEDYGSARVGWSQSLRKLARLLDPVPAGARG